MIASSVEGATLGAQACSHGSKLVTFASSRAAGSHGVGSLTAALIGGTAMGRMDAATFIPAGELAVSDLSLRYPARSDDSNAKEVRFAAGSLGEEVLF